MLFCPFPPSGVIAVDVAEFAFQLVQCLAEGHPVPSQFFLGFAWTTGEHRLHHLGHEMTALVSAQAGLRLVECFANLGCQFHLSLLLQGEYITDSRTLLFLDYPK